MGNDDVRPDDMLPDLTAPIDSDLAWIVMVLDRSGSMGSARESTVAAFNEFVRDQQQVPGEARMTLIQFDDVYEVVFSKPIQDVPLLTQDTFVPRGGTALYDAQGKAIATLQEQISKLAKAKRPSKVVFVTLTDGGENASKEYKMGTIANLIQKMKDQYKWQFIYLGANQDAFAASSSMNYAAANTMNFMMSQVGSTMNSASASVRSLRGTPALAYSKLSNEEVEKVMAFSDDDRKSALSSGNFSGISNVTNDPFLAWGTTPAVTVPPDEDDNV
jgi:uncharacterized protein YegL